MKTLFISDLDGTLLDTNAQISEFTRNAINELTAKGVFISVATARTAATVIKMLKGTNINTPVMLMNGVCTYDLQKGVFTEVRAMSETAKHSLADIIHTYNLDGFLYTIDDNCQHTFYERVTSDVARNFISEREKLYGKVFTKVDSFTDILDRTFAYYSFCSTPDKLDSAYDALSRIPELHTEYYRDIYNENHWYLEVASAGSSKYNAVCSLRRSHGFERVVGFGDNLNDLALFEGCDESYAVSNAKDKVKEAATGVILSNAEDAVVKKIIEMTKEM